MVAVAAVAVVVTAGGAAPAISAVAAVGNGMAAATTASTIAAGSLIGSGTVLTGLAITTAAVSPSDEDFFRRGGWGTVAATGLGAVGGAVDGAIVSWRQWAANKQATNQQAAQVQSTNSTQSSTTTKSPKSSTSLTTPEDFLNEALRQQGLEVAPKEFKQPWLDNGYKFEVRAHTGDSRYTDAASIYRVSRQHIPVPGTQGTGLEYLAADGKWYHNSVLTEFHRNGQLNPLYNSYAGRYTHHTLWK